MCRMLARYVLRYVSERRTGTVKQMGDNKLVLERGGKRVIATAKEDTHSAVVFQPEKRTTDTVAIFVHGYSGIGENLAILAKETAMHGVEAHLLQLPGHGGPKLDEYDVRAFVEYVKEYAKRVGKNRPILLVGHSLGGELVKLVRKELEKEGYNVDTVHIAPAGYRDRAVYRILDFFGKTKAGARLAMWSTLRKLGREVLKEVDPRAVAAYGHLLQRYPRREATREELQSWLRGDYYYGLHDTLVPRDDVVHRFMRGFPYVKGYKIRDAPGSHDFYLQIKGIVSREIAHAAQKLSSRARQRNSSAHPR